MNLSKLQGPTEIRTVLMLRKDLGQIGIENIVDYMQQMAAAAEAAGAEKEATEELQS